MKLRRTWPAICIWGVFLLFDIVMVASLCFFLGLFPSDKALYYSGGIALLSALVMSVVTILLSRLSDAIGFKALGEKTFFNVLYSCLIVLIIGASVYYRVEILSSTAGDIGGKYSLYENAMIGGQNVTAEYDLLSILYSTILRGILLFTGNIISVPFFFQIACFTLFMICSYFTVKKLLGRAAAFVYTTYVAFMPIFTTSFTGLTLSTDYLFMAMFGIEFLVVALYLRGAYKGSYTSAGYLLWYIFVGIVVGFMAYVDAGTIIMILPFLVAVLFLCGRDYRYDLVRLVITVLVAVITFFLMIAQEAGFAFFPERLDNWASYYFHNLNTFSMFWIYTDHKILYLITAVAMSGVIVGFWKNRKFERVSPWLLSMLFIFATVPFMGATRMNTQAFVTVYYAFILGCVASLIITPSDEEGEYAIPELSEDELEKMEEMAEAADEEIPDEELPNEELPGEELSVEETPATEQADENFTTATITPEEDVHAVTPDNVIPYEPEPEPEPEKEPAPEQKTEPEAALEPQKDRGPRYVPEGMVLPEDDDDVDLTPRMKMPTFDKVGLGSRSGKLKVKSNKEHKEPSPEPKDDFDIAFTDGDDFDIK
ncbi:MAG: hypothetical protein J6I68_13790 [Butyrivibrio sp.]|uniref:glycosyltransferase family 39 protein n=1 Tax=Butyrivibrio sp. TaxID=28121 RepID=UPI001B561A7B|nr:glycosyltransferase family 39 protein [Butyrivibrio sp.]MBP3784311.1 hypothetical protein [Butyrivibrio sp.]